MFGITKQGISDIIRDHPILSMCAPFVFLVMIPAIGCYLANVVMALLDDTPIDQALHTNNLLNNVFIVYFFVLILITYLCILVWILHMQKNITNQSTDDQPEPEDDDEI